MDTSKDYFKERQIKDRFILSDRIEVLSNYINTFIIKSPGLSTKEIELVIDIHETVLSLLRIVDQNTRDLKGDQ